MTFRTSVISSNGGRPVNEDTCECVEDRGSLCCIVADGLGGQFGGEIASRLTADAVLAGFHSDPSCEIQRVGDLLQAANDAIVQRQAAAPQLSAMRSTAVLLLSGTTHAVWGHVGDSRLYRFEQGRVVFQTKDHSVPQALSEAGEIRPADIRFHEDRGRLLRSLGSPGEFRPTLVAEKHKLAQSDAFLLCTDGFWEYVTETEMEVDYSKSSSPDAWLQRMTDRIARQAPSGHDNYSAIAVWREE